MNTSGIERYLNLFASQVVKESRGLLQSSKGSTALANTIRYKIKKDANGYSTEFYMEDYGTYLDEGVSGTSNTQSYTAYTGKKRVSQYKYKTKQPPSGVIERWIKRKGIKPTGKKISDKSLAFAIARTIKLKGIKSISFFQIPLGIGLKKLNENFLKELTLDIKSYLTTYTKQ